MIIYEYVCFLNKDDVRQMGPFNNYVDKKRGQQKVHAFPLNVHVDPN